MVDTASNFAEYRPGGSVMNFPGGNATHGIDFGASTFRVGANLASPVLTWTATPPLVTTKASAFFAYRAQDADDLWLGIRLSCTLDANSAICPATPNDSETAFAMYENLAPGTHTFTLAARDGAGHSSSASYTWTVDPTPPTISLSLATQPFTVRSTVPVSWSATDAGAGVASYDARWRRTTRTRAFGSWNLPVAWQGMSARQVASPVLVAGSTYCFSARARDLAGNVSEWSKELCTTRAVDDRALVASTGWSDVKDTRSYEGTSSVTKRQGATLRLKETRLARLALIAMTCRTCGTVEVFVGKQRVGQISLRSTRTRQLQVLALPSFRPRTGIVELRAVTTRGKVSVDGLAVSQV